MKASFRSRNLQRQVFVEIADGIRKIVRWCDSIGNVFKQPIRSIQMDRIEKRIRTRSILCFVAFASVAMTAVADGFTGLHPYGTNVNDSVFCTTGRVSQIISSSSEVAEIRAYAAVSCVADVSVDVFASRAGFQLLIR
jgi:hypothetical protein